VTGFTFPASIPLPMKKSALVVLMLLLQALGATAAWANWNPDWTRRMKCTLDTSPVGLALTAPVENVPVLVRLHTGNFQFLDAKPDGSDLRFIAADDKTPLKFHIERYDGLNELAFVWVYLPKLQAGAKDGYVWLYYGNEKAAPASDAKSGHDVAQALVYHFGENEATPQDATANGNHAARMTARPSPASLAGAGALFDGKGEIAINASPTLQAGAGGLTVSMWLKPTALDDATLWRLGEGPAALSLGLRGGSLALQAGAGNTATGGTLAAGSWQHVALVVQNGVTVYLNGTEVARSNATPAPQAGPMVVGPGYKGELDEFTVASTARSADWLRVAAGGQGPGQKLIGTVAAEAGEPEEGVSYLRILLGAVTLDGWIVIALLGVMFVISFWVMISKAFLVRSLARDNARFMAQFGRMMEGVSPGQAPAERQQAEQEAAALHGRSPLYRLYAAAMSEVHTRFDSYQRSGRALLLNESSLAAIKATLDARLVRELQGLNSKLVVLTVSIAGGPFLGLLGTVVGVMITFAAIAAAGDVNVNAIAPGIAAALVATVAGLAVAIPCLFGYNFLTTRIGEITADLQAFVDELVTRIAENHTA